jgi:hypothetical protein
MQDMMRKTAGHYIPEGFMADAERKIRNGRVSAKDVFDAVAALGGERFEGGVEEFFDGGVAIPRGESGTDVSVMHFPFPHAPPRLPPRFSDAEASARDRAVSIYTSVFGAPPSGGTVTVLTRRLSEFEGDDKRLFNLVSTLYTVSKMQTANDDARLQAAISATLKDLEARPGAADRTPSAAVAVAEVKPMDQSALAAAVSDTLRAADSDVGQDKVTQAIADWRAVTPGDYDLMRRPNADRTLQAAIDTRQFAASDVYNMHLGGAPASQPASTAAA